MADQKVGKRSMGRKGRSKMESGTCNVCSAPCSLCLHRSTPGLTGSKCDESSDETGPGIAASQCSVNEDDVLRSSRVIKAHSDSHTASEASNLVNSNHDTFSENAESKEIVRSSEVSNDSGAFEMSSKVSSVKIGVNHKPFATANVLDQSPKCVKGQEDRRADDPNTKACNKDSSVSSALVSDPILDASDQNHDFTKADPCSALPDEAKSQSLPCPSFNHEDKNSSGLEKMKEKSGVQSNRDSKNIMTEGSAHFCQDSNNEKSDENAEAQKAEGPNTSAMSENESDDSEMVEHDVKVCDICGDAGREDLLAICSRCSDGAEHTYCMREMIDEVPEGDWLCEECKFAEEAEQQKLEAKKNRETGPNLNAQTSDKRCAEKAEAALDVKRQAVEGPTGSPKKSILPRIAALSREPSFKALDKPKRTLVHQTSFTSLSSDDAESTHSTDSQFQSTKVGESSINEKDEPSSVSRPTEGLTSHATVNTPDATPRSREFREMGEKSKEVFINRSRASLPSGSKGLASQKEGQTAEPIDTSCASESDPSTTKKFREDINKGNRLRAAVDAALRKKPNFGKNRGSQLPDGSLVSNMDSSCDKTSQSQLPLKTTKNSMSSEGPQGGELNLKIISDPYKQAIATNGKQLPFSAADAMYSPRSADLEVNFPSVKPVMRDWPLVPTIVLPKTSAIPEHEYIWQGDLEVQSSRNLLEMHSGIQAHLSTLASPKVREMVNKFLGKVPLNEVPRLSTWPAQFRDTGAKEDHIALFFFAKDIESYEKNYKPLVVNMIKKDLALKGNLGSVELLIFASNQLPRHCQRWNMLFFLWGVFRGRKESSSNPLNNPSLPPTSNVLPHDRDQNLSNQRHLSLKHAEKMPSARESYCSTTETESKVGVSSHVDLNNKESSIVLPSIGSEVNNKDSNLSPRFMSSSMQSCPKAGCSNPLEEKTAPKDDVAGVSPIPLLATGTGGTRNESEKTSSASSDEDGLVKEVPPAEEQKIGDGTQVKEEETSGSGENPALTATDLEGRSGERENISDRNLSCGQAGERKRPFLDLTVPAMEDSSENGEILYEGSANKKPKTDHGGENEGRVSGKDSAPRKGDMLGPSSSTETRDHHHRSGEEKNEMKKMVTIKKETDERAERIVFPLDLNEIKEEDSPIPLCGNQRLLHGPVPNLELALGVEETTVTFTEHGDGNRHKTQDQMMMRMTSEVKQEEEEEEASSLSLSLAFPSMETEQSLRRRPMTVSSSEQEMQKKNVNTPPLFLFRDLTDKSI
ncbi:PREDICTED: uncharacterized protein LOC104820905 isoform X2 [Tarenaya hassleriana]|uniref:uncharacterized protein LOC104820905 isoform X2 n=1 Tax=Tarenaya hassleriana TaxID=28532 RepID=UPI00053C2777|nr:PREDICTED: uncharacterized protein LOC104820905 isoform X2 [Tarenaya hassleriana]